MSERMQEQQDEAEARKPRIWALHCPFTKTGFPVLGNFGRTIRPVVIIPMATWTKLCQDIPELGKTQFEVGASE